MARFVLSQLIDRARRLARVTSNSVSDENVKDLINEGLREFGKEVQGLWSQEYITVVPKFNARTNWYYYIASDSASTSVAICTDSINMATGSTVAASLTTALQNEGGNWATASIVWDSDQWAFVAIVPSSTYIEIAPPSADTYVDASEKIWGSSATQTSASFLGTFPEDCTVEASLPAGFLNLIHAEWNQTPLEPAPSSLFVSPEYQGTDPAYYSVYNKNIRIYPTPTVQKLFEIWYKKLPTEFGEASSSVSASISLDQEYELAPVYYAASVMAEENFESKIADRYYGRFLLQCRRYTQQFANQNPQMFPQSATFRQPSVDPETPSD